MPGGNKNIKPEDNPKPYTSENHPRDGGRKKKILTVIREKGYEVDDVRKVYNELIWYDREEIHNIMKDDSKPWIVVFVASLLDKGMARKDYRQVKEILEQVLGSPQQNVNTTGDQTIEVILNDKRKEKDKS